MVKKNIALISHSILQELLGVAEDGNLDSLVEIVATKMEVSVCSCYLLRPGDLLELVATYGLAPSAIGNTFLHLDEGVVGEVATSHSVVNLKNAWKSKNFSFRPETEEKDFKSFLGVPIIDNDKFLGVLCIQNTTTSKFLPEEEELLKTIAMLIAESFTNNPTVSDTSLSLSHEENNFHGYKISSGLGVGKAVLHRQVKPVIKLVAKDVKKEQDRLKKALEDMQEQISHILSGLKAQKGEHVDIMATYLVFSNDKSWVSKLNEAISSGLTAEAAAQKVFKDIKSRLEQSSDDYLRARISDFEDLTNRIISHLSGNISIDMDSLPHDIILCAQNMGPAELFDYEFGRVKGIVLEEGSRNMHIAIIARSLGIPVVGGLAKILRKIENNNTIIIDGYNAEIIIDPSPEIEDRYNNKIISIQDKIAIKEKLVNVPTVTKNGINIRLNVNVGLLIDVEAISQYNADGIGLYRTELAFMLNSHLPDVDNQVSIYKSVIDKAGGKPVVFRTLDIGSDKVLQYFHGDKEENPAMGWRSVRISLDRKAIFRHQLRALLRANSDGDLYVMFPMISNVSEFKEAKKTLDRELELEKNKGNAVPKKIKVGVMLEVPALIFQLQALLPLVDFVSVGTNDLTQFMYACDRSNMGIYERYDVLSPAMIEALSFIVNACDEANVPCSVCGEMAGNPLDAMVLIGLGFRSLSLNPFRLISVKEMVLSLDTVALKEYIESFKGSSYDSVREHFRSFAIDHGIIIDDNLI